jgi:hypothetical protein
MDIQTCVWIDASLLHAPVAIGNVKQLTSFVASARELLPMPDIMGWSLMSQRRLLTLSLRAAPTSAVLKG